MNSVIPRRAPKNKFVSFLPLLIAVVIVVAVVFLIRSLLSGDNKQGPNAPVASFVLSSGQARVNLSGDASYSVEPGSGETFLNRGEGVETVGNSRLELRFQDDTVVRLDGNTAVTIDDFTSNNNKKDVRLSLGKGAIWINVANPDRINSFVVLSRLSSINLNQGGIFAITRNAVADSYRGMKSMATVTVMDNTQKSLTTQTLSLGQQITVNDSMVSDLLAKKTVQMLSLIDDEFRNSDWYAYNTARDNNAVVSDTMPTNSGMLNMNDNSSETSDTTSNDNTNVDTSDTTGAGPNITITSPKNGTTLSDTVVLIEGTVSADATKVVVDDYTLSKYVAGQRSWSYSATLANTGLVKGLNVVKAYALDKNGNKSQVASVSFTYKPNANANTNSSAVRVPAPVITQPTTGSDYTTSDSKVIIQGTVDSSVTKVFVNGYQLQKFVSGSGQWLYYAYEEYDTLKPGSNTYSIYALDKDGNKSPTVTLKIQYNKSGTGSGSVVQ